MRLLPSKEPVGELTDLTPHEVTLVSGLKALPEGYFTKKYCPWVATAGSFGSSRN